MPLIDSDPPASLRMDGGIAHVALARPDNRNALTVEMLTSVSGRLDAAVHAGARAVVLSGDGPAFCAGLDLREEDPERLRRSIELLLAVMRQMLTLPVPVVARLDGPARAGGLGLVAAADFAIARTDVDFSFTEVRLGLAPAAISVCVLPRLRSRDATRLLLTAERIDADRAARIGLIDEAVDASAMDARVDATLTALVAAHPQGMAATKLLLTAGIVSEIDAHGADLVAASFALFTSPAARRAIAAARRR
ncbi:enoyl-CoA hydratase-related protein [Microbacterium enclense]|uniref:enoyl-CoA hydratase-related protein n=1 Tax=Microbacterium enclense TaxID=993073 RepID=UPI0021A8E6EF|nr:enoyl-CoA hydratase-related protein [Microbacterium enclense]MCT2086865.1 enoyl-CoA hydratase-related protein [Microbacterium enclense]